MLYLDDHDSSVSSLNSAAAAFDENLSRSMLLCLYRPKMSARCRGITNLSQLGRGIGFDLSRSGSWISFMTSWYTVRRLKSQKKMLPAALQNARTGFWSGTLWRLKRMKNCGPQLGVWNSSRRVY